MYNPYELSAFCLYWGRTRKASADTSQKYLNLPFIGIDYCLCTEIHTQQCRDGGFKCVCTRIIHIHMESLQYAYTYLYKTSLCMHVSAQLLF